jgi:hypothetical protein
MPLNFQLNGNTFTTVPNQPGVVDPQSDPLIVPSRTVIITARDAKGAQVSGTYNVLQNFLTGYGLSISTTASCATTAAEACAGEDSLISLVPVTNGLRYANKQMRFTANFGPFAFILDSTGITGPTVVSTADTAGGVTARIRVTANTRTQYGQFRLTDVATGAYRDFTFVIKNANGSNVPLSILPSSLSLTGATSAACGTGLVNVFVYGGLGPYTASTTFPGSIAITPSTVAKSGDAFSVQVFNSNICLSPGTVVITDSLGAFVTMDITTAVGTTDPVLPLTVAPTGLCIADGGSGVISISGGNANKVINSGNLALAKALPVTGTGNFTITISGVGVVAPVPPATTVAVTFTVDDGGSQVRLNILRKTTCP